MQVLDAHLQRGADTGEPVGEGGYQRAVAKIPRGVDRDATLHRQGTAISALPFADGMSWYIYATYTGSVMEGDPDQLFELLDKANGGRTLSTYQKNQIVFSQDEPADSVFYVQKAMKLTVLSEQGKEAVVAILGTGDFMLGRAPQRMATAAAIAECKIMRLEKQQ